MTEQGYNEFEKTLYDNGFKKSNGVVHGSDWYFYKAVRRKKDKYGDVRAVSQLLYCIYDVRKYHDKDDYLLEKIIDVSRNVDERCEFTIMADLGISEMEELADKFYDFVCKNVKLEED